MNFSIGSRDTEQVVAVVAFKRRGPAEEVDEEDLELSAAKVGNATRLGPAPLCRRWTLR